MTFRAGKNTFPDLIKFREERVVRKLFNYQFGIKIVADHLCQGCLARADVSLNNQIINIHRNQIKIPEQLAPGF
jgi:hypothetical protein